jgi:hypothetical protein
MIPFIYFTNLCNLSGQFADFIDFSSSRAGNSIALGGKKSKVSELIGFVLQKFFSLASSQRRRHRLQFVVVCSNGMMEP